MDLAMFREPLGMIKIIELITSILSFLSTLTYHNELKFVCGQKSYSYIFDYPFDLQYAETMCSKQFQLFGNFSSDARFYVAAGVMAMIYSLFMILIHAYFDSNYKGNPRYPFFDFGFTLLFSILWLSGTAAWANGVIGLKNATDPYSIRLRNLPCCNIAIGGFFSLNMSIIVGFLNFFIWGCNLWFVYKETSWFNKQTTRTPNA